METAGDRFVYGIEVYFYNVQKGSLVIHRIDSLRIKIPLWSFLIFTHKHTHT